MEVGMCNVAGFAGNFELGKRFSSGMTVPVEFYEVFTHASAETVQSMREIRQTCAGAAKSYETIAHDSAVSAKSEAKAPRLSVVTVELRAVTRWLSAFPAGPKKTASEPGADAAEASRPPDRFGKQPGRHSFKKYAGQ